MFDVSKIQTRLTGLVGIRQSYDPEYIFLNTAIQASESGLYLNDIEMFSIEAWMDSQSFKDATSSQLNEMLTNLQKSSISNVCNLVFSEWNRSERNVLYTNASDRDSFTDVTNGTFYGYKIEFENQRNLGFRISRVFLEFEGTGEITLRLYNSQRIDFLEEKVITVTDKWMEVDLDWYVNENIGEYFVGYVSDGSVKPFVRDIDDSIVISKFKNLEVDPIYVSSFVDFTNQRLVIENSIYNGLNLDVTVFDDYTDVICQNKHLFAKAIQYDWAIRVMIGYASSIRTNRVQKISKEMIATTLQAIEGVRNDNVYKQGLRSIVNHEITQIKKEIDKLRQTYLGSEDAFHITTLS